MVDESEASSHRLIFDTSVGVKSFFAVPCLFLPETSLALLASKFHLPCKSAFPTGADGFKIPSSLLTTVPPALEASARK